MAHQFRPLSLPSSDQEEEVLIGLEAKEEESGRGDLLEAKYAHVSWNKMDFFTS